MRLSDEAVRNVGRDICRLFQANGNQRLTEADLVSQLVQLGHPKPLATVAIEGLVRGKLLEAQEIYTGHVLQGGLDGNPTETEAPEVRWTPEGRRAPGFRWLRGAGGLWELEKEAAATLRLQHEPTPATQAAEPKAKQPKPAKKAGRPRKWQHLWELIRKHGAENGIGIDQRIANEHNKLCAARIISGECDKVDAKKVADVRREYSGRKRKH